MCHGADISLRVCSGSRPSPLPECLWVTKHGGLDVSLKDTAIAIREDGHRIWRCRCRSDPVLIAQTVRKNARDPQSVVFEIGPLATWFFHVLKGEGLPAICIEARHAQKILGETLNKTDANDAKGLAKLAETGFYKAVWVKLSAAQSEHIGGRHSRHPALGHLAQYFYAV